MTRSTQSAYERWTWLRCQAQILSLKYRLGYSDRLWILGFELLDDGRLVDPFHGVEVFDPASGDPATMIPSRYSAIPEMYCILHTYAATTEAPLSGEALPLSTLDTVHPPKLTTNDCTALLPYTDQDFASLQAVDIPFFGKELDQGDLAFEVYPLPGIPVTFILWCGDEEMPDSGTLLFDQSASHYLPNLLVELAWLTVWRLKNILDSGVKWGYHSLSSLG